jgi:hypothetical protein
MPRLRRGSSWLKLSNRLRLLETERTRGGMTKMAKMISLIIAVLLLGVSPSQAVAYTHFFYVAPAPLGSDTNDCLTVSTPCQTLQRAADLAPLGSLAKVSIAAGTYAAGANIYYFKLVHFVGDCSNIGAVVINPGAAATAFTGQDHVIGMLACLTIGPSYLAISTRGLAIWDTWDIRSLGSTITFSAGESSRINCGGVAELSGNTVYLIAATNHSCNVKFTAAVNAASFVYAVQQSLVTLVGATVTNPGNFSGMRWILDNAELAGSSNVPGSGVVENPGSRVN